MKLILTTLTALFALFSATFAADDVKYPLNVTVGSTWTNGVFRWSRDSVPGEKPEAVPSSILEMNDQTFHVIPQIGFGPGEADHSINLEVVRDGPGAATGHIKCTINVVDFAAQNGHFVMFAEGEMDGTMKILKAPGIEVVCPPK